MDETLRTTREMTFSFGPALFNRFIDMALPLAGTYAHQLTLLDARLLAGRATAEGEVAGRRGKSAERIAAIAASDEVTVGMYLGRMQGAIAVVRAGQAAGEVQTLTILERRKRNLGQWLLRRPGSPGRRLVYHYPPEETA
ncbi:MAG TPA: hypothetical protein VGS28_05090 [Candidatus Saccharimonadales bacterium]|nr:hypothetical protein [Candidatus Saccharimonadales bacterium]